MRWFEWDSIEDFNVWHNAKIDELNLPLASVNQATGEIDPTAQKTVAYTTPHEVENKIIAMVEDEHAQGLTETNLRLPEPGDFIEA
jgi:hypothetical protein